MWQQRQRRIQRRIGPTSQAFWTDEHRPIQDTEKQRINKETQDKYNLPHEDRYRSLYLNKAKNLCVCLFIVPPSRKGSRTDSRCSHVKFASVVALIFLK